MRILSGIQPSGKLHLGNYLGAIKQHIELQEKGDAFYFIADYHALTSLRDKEALQQYSFDVALDYLALGLDPKKATFYRQSDIPEVTELSWILSTITPMGLLERCHSYKDKIAKGISPDHGLFAYPVLMAADILIVDADIVPVGRDQKQHVEVTRDIAQKFNFTFGDTLRVPEDRIREDAGVIPGIDGQKMSKSYGNAIDIFLEGKELKDRVMSIVTDSAPVEQPKDPDQNNVYNLLKFFIPEEEERALREAFIKGGVKYSDCKKRLIKALDDTFGPARERRRELLSRPGEVNEVLREGAARARETARSTLQRVREAVGLGKSLL